MSIEQQNDEAPLIGLTPVCLADMTDDELEKWHSRIRGITQNHATFVAAIRERKATGTKAAVKQAPSGEAYE